LKNLEKRGVFEEQRGLVCFGADSDILKPLGKKIVDKEMG